MLAGDSACVGTRASQHHPLCAWIISQPEEQGVSERSAQNVSVTLVSVNSATLNIPGTPGPLRIENSFWKGLRFSINGHPIKPHGFPRNRLTLPGMQGPIEAKIKGGALHAHPSLIIGGQEFMTGPPTPKIQQVLALLPLLLLVLVQGALGFLIAFGAIAANMGIIRAEHSAGTKVGLLLATLVAAATVDVLILSMFV